MSARKPKRPAARQGQPNIKALHFCDSDRDLPIAGTPAPKPCPFCGVADCSIVFGEVQENGSQSAHVECDHCGAEAPYGVAEGGSSYDLALSAARMWNERKGGAS